MTLLEISDQVCNKVGKTDTYSKNICKNFVRFRYRTIWEGFLWTESKTTATQSIPSGTGDFTVSSTLELVTMVIYDGTPLKQFQLEQLLSLSPTFLTDSGQPRAFINKPKVAGNCVIRFDCIPTLTKNATIAGKSVFVPLTADSDQPVIRGINDVLLAYVEGDMWQYIEQSSTANDKYAEAQGLLSAVTIDLEKQQQTQTVQLMPTFQDWQLSDLVTTTQNYNNNNWFLRG